MPEDPILDVLMQFQKIQEDITARTERISQQYLTLLVEWKQFLENHDSRVRHCLDEIKDLLFQIRNNQAAKQVWWSKVIVPILVAIITALSIIIGAQKGIISIP